MMRTLRVAVWAFFICLILGCESSEQQSIRRSVEQHMERYPHSTLCDLYKNYFQDNFGPGHIISDPTSADRYLRYELESVEEFTGEDYESAGHEGNFYRVNLKVIADGRVSYEQYFDAFIRSAQGITPPTMEQWQKKWQAILCEIEAMGIALPDMQADKAKIKAQLAAGETVMHHSRLFNEHYAPHYRIIEREIFLKEILPLIKK